MNTQIEKTAATLNGKEITLANLERLSGGWNGKTIEILLSVGGAGNMFGGYSTLMHICVHGSNSIYNGLIECKGIAKDGYNIARGANGDSYGEVYFWKGETDAKKELDYTKPFYKIRVDGSCATGLETLCSILSTTRDFYKEI